MPTPKRAQVKGPLMDQDASAYQVSTVRLTREQWAALRREAMRRATDKASAKTDTSEVLREVVEAWRKKGGK
jgi:hypothetical protein